MKKLLIIALSLSFFGMSCTKDISSFNEQTKRAASGAVPGETLFSNATKNFVDVLASPNVNINVFRFTVQHWAATTYQDEPQYDFETRGIPAGLWTRMYRTVLANLKEAETIITADESLSEGEKANKLAICDIMEVNVYYFLITTFGDVPYTEALDPENVFPKYDDAKTIYADLLSRLATDASTLNSAENGITADQDIIYGGDVDAWKKFANSFLLRMAMTIADSDPSTAKSVFESANANAFTSAADNAELVYLDATPNTNPVWVDLVQSGRQDMVAGAPLLDKLVAMKDPRLPLYFRPNANGDWVGGIVGSNNTFSQVSKPSEQMVEPTFPQIILGYSEVEFLRAEAIERGFNIPGTAAEHYNNAVTASILWWGGTAAQAATYLAQPSVAYATATGDWKQKIGIQKWIALYNQDVQGWIEMRRLDYPKLPRPVGADIDFPTRLPYSQSEQVLNPTSYTSAAQAIGGDVATTKLWWDKF